MFRTLALTTTFLTALALPAFAQEATIPTETVIGQEAAVPADQLVAQEATPADPETDPRAAAIVATMATLSELSEERLGQAIANIMVAFTAVTDEAEFLSALNMWNTQLNDPEASAAVDPDSPLEVEPQDLIASMEASNWISAGGSGQVLHYYMDPACDLCVETLSVLGDMSAEGVLDLRVTLLPLVDDTSFPLMLGLLSDRDTAWERLTGYLAGEIPAEDIAVDPSVENEELQAAVEADYDAFIASGIRSIPFMGFMHADGEPRFIQGSLSREEAETLILGE